MPQHLSSHPEARVEWSVLRRWLMLLTPYSHAFVDDLKLRVPYQARLWDKTAKVWFIRPDAGPDVAELLVAYFGGFDLAEEVPALIANRLYERLEASEALRRAQEEEAARMAASKAAVAFAWGFPSSGRATSYEVLLRRDGTISCNCPGWVFRKVQNCAHVQEVKSLQEIVATTAGGQPVQALALQVIAILDTPGRWGGSTWMGAPEDDPNGRIRLGAVEKGLPMKGRVLRRVEGGDK